MTASSRYFKSKEARDFHPAEFPEVVAELAALKARLGNFTQPETDVVIISYVKTHSIRSDYAKTHAVLIKLLTSKGSCVHLENIFTACQGNSRFIKSLESFLKDEMNAFHLSQSSLGYPNDEMKFDITHLVTA